jgi:DNA-directed RNA polymerase subunit delta
MANEAPLLAMDQERARETALVDLAYAVLRETNQSFNFRDLMQQIALLRGMTDEEMARTIAMLYTEINIDGRFLCIGNNVWGLKRWYPVDKTAEKSTGGKKFVRKDIDDLYDDGEDADLFLEEETDEEELSFDEEDIDLEELPLEDEVDEFAEEAADEDEDTDSSDNEEDEDY